jgi:hypothetical protein
MSCSSKAVGLTSREEYSTVGSGGGCAGFAGAGAVAVFDGGIGRRVRSIDWAAS